MLNKLLGWVVPMLVPAVLLMSAVRILMTPAFVRLEYQMPNFPEDTYGFTQQDRMKLGPIALEYLLNDSEISFLGELKFEDGTELYNDREMGHMADVKNLTQRGLNIWYVLLALYVILGIWARRVGWWASYKSVLSKGGKYTTYLIGILLVVIIISFNFIFTGFHRIFFEGDTWLFLFSDTLIRLFPMRFWQDAFIFLGIISLVEGLALWYFLGTDHKKL
ncbi:MAG: TIGR01906 family membrane protein [Chloroflexi bacterium]|nr:TIGR01906 family membrane protein [Chloroflexota bacterium]